MPDIMPRLYLKATHLCKQIPLADGELRLLDHLDLEAKAGESIAITGTSGCGKSTLLALLAGLDQPSGGTIELLDQPLTTLNEDQRAALRLGQIGFVFQAFHLIPHLTAEENVRLPLELGRHQTTGHAIKNRAREVLQQVGLGQRLHHLPGQLSGGEQQRVALARAFVYPVKILFADEPTGNLDFKTATQMMDLLFNLQQHYQTTLVLVTHDPALAQRCDTHYQLQNGKLHAQPRSSD